VKNKEKSVKTADGKTEGGVEPEAKVEQNGKIG